MSPDPHPSGVILTDPDGMPAAVVIDGPGPADSAGDVYAMVRLALEVLGLPIDRAGPWAGRLVARGDLVARTWRMATGADVAAGDAPFDALEMGAAGEDFTGAPLTVVTAAAALSPGLVLADALAALHLEDLAQEAAGG